MFEKQLRKATKGLVEGLATPFLALGISPNTISVVSLLVGVVAAYAIASGVLVHAVLLIVLSGVLDGVDGTVARLSGRTSKWGAFLDSTLDKIVEIVLFIGIYFYAPSLALPVMVCISVMMLSSYTNKHIAAFNVQTSGHRPFFYISSFADRTERLLLVVLALLLPAYMEYLLYAYIVLLSLSVFQRIWEGYKLLQ